ncbi:MAG: ribonuclease Z, partial [Candidatus Helarchaeota archaeon]
MTGLPGVIMSLALGKREKPLYVYGPNGIKEFINTTMNIMQFDLTYPLEIIEINKQEIFEFKNYKIICFPLEHRIFTLGFAIIENPTATFDVKKAEKLKIPKGPLWGNLKSGKTVTLKDGRIIKPSQVLGNIKHGKKILICLDTRPTKKTKELSDHADLLIHDGMFEEKLQEVAVNGGHSTVVEVAKLAKNDKIKKLVITHISSRYE